MMSIIIMSTESQRGRTNNDRTSGKGQPIDFAPRTKCNADSRRRRAVDAEILPNVSAL
jgi:hypothetical protein